MSDHVMDSQERVFAERWLCVEWKSSGESRTYIDGAEVTDLHQATVRTTIELWIDDVMIDAAPIGCEA